MKTNTAEDLLNALMVEEANMATYRTQLGFDSAEMTECSQDRGNLAAALDNAAIVEADKKMVTKVKNEIYEGDSKESISPYPTFTLTPLPFPSVNGGAVARYKNRRARAKLAAGYTKQIGIAMGYQDEPGAPIGDELLVAALKPSDLGGYQYKVEFRKQGKSGMLIQERLKCTEKWAKQTTALESPVTIAVDEPSAEGAAVQIEIRGKLLNGNTPVGQWSPIYSITVNA